MASANDELNTPKTSAIDPSVHEPITPDSSTHTTVAEDVDTRTPAGKAPDGIARTRAAALWTGLVAGALILILLLVFILQNLYKVRINILAWDFQAPLGIALLLAAIGGALVMALVGGVRILQIRRAAKKK